MSFTSNVYRESASNDSQTSSQPKRPKTDQRLGLVLGASLMAFSLYLGLSFISFLFTGSADQSVIEGLSWSDFRSSAQEVENWLGLTGAILSHLLVYRWFGIASILLAPLLGWIGRLIWKKQSVRSSARIFRDVLVLMLWLSVLLGYFTTQVQGSTELAFWCGGVGYTVATFLSGIIGFGTLFLLAIIAFAYIIYFVRPDLLASFKLATPKPSQSTTSRAKTSETETEVGERPDQDQNEKVRPLFSEDAPRREENPQETTNIFATEEKKPKERPRSVRRLFERKPKIEDPKVEEEKTETKRPKTHDEVPSNAEREIARMRGEEVEENTDKPTPLFAEENQSSDSALRPSQESSTPDDVPFVVEDNSEKDSEEALSSLFDPTPTQNDFQDAEEDENIDFPEGEESPDPVKQLPYYTKPPSSLLEDHDSGGHRVDPTELQTNKDKIVGTLANFKIGVDAIKAEVGPTVTLYEIIPSQGVKISQIRNLEDDIALNLAALGIRIIAPMPGRGTIGIEVPNKDRETVSLKSLIQSKVFRETKKDLPVVFGKTISNEVFITDLAKMPHLLIGGATGQGKSVGINVLLTSLLYKRHPGELKIVLIDPKKVEFSLYNKLQKHFIAHLPDSSESVITESDEAIRVLNALCVEMDKRYTLLKRAKCRQVKEYNAKMLSGKISMEDGHRFLPYIVIVIDELADLMLTVGKSIEKPIARLAQMARAVGMHMVVATQRPSVNVLTGVIKANFPARMAFRVTSKVDSRVVLDMGGAEQLVGRGDMLLSNGSEVIRLQCAFIDTEEVEGICDFVSKQDGYVKKFYLPEWGGHLEAEENDKKKKKKGKQDEEEFI